MIPIAPGLEVGGDLGELEAVLSLIRAKEARWESLRMCEKHETKLPAGVKNGEMGCLEGTWDRFGAGIAACFLQGEPG